MNYFEFINSVKICSGENAIENIAYELDFLGCKNPIILSDNGVSNPEFLILKKEDNLEKRNKLMTVLSPFEQSVCEMMFMEYDYRQIAAKLNKEEKVIDNAMQRIKLKAKKIFKD